MHNLCLLCTYISFSLRYYAFSADGNIFCCAQRERRDSKGFVSIICVCVGKISAFFFSLRLMMNAFDSMNKTQHFIRVQSQSA